MTVCYLTIDTEYSVALTRRLGVDCRKANFERSIACLTDSGSVGLEYQMDILDAHGLKAVFFVDPMPSLIWGKAAIEDIVGPVIARGHDVQMHIHTEWLEVAGERNPLQGRIGTNLKDFSLEDQYRLLEYGRDVLIAAGAAAPVALRAGNYGANDDTLRALASFGLRYDTSHCPGIVHSACDISLSSSDRAPLPHCGVVEVPIGCITAPHGGFRHAQLTALSAREILDALKHCRQQEVKEFTLVSHSFELLSRDRLKINGLVKRRFEHLCTQLGKMAGVSTGTYSENPPQIRDGRSDVPTLPFNALRTCERFIQQMVSNALYGRK